MDLNLKKSSFFFSKFKNCVVKKKVVKNELRLTLSTYY